MEICNLPCNTVTAEHIKALVMFQEDSDLKLAPNPTNAPLNPSHFHKMKVSQVLNFFSHSTSAALRYLVKCWGYSKEFLTSAWLFDHVNVVSFQFCANTLEIDHIHIPNFVYWSERCVETSPNRYGALNNIHSLPPC